jgi:hypothetical protein
MFVSLLMAIAGVVMLLIRYGKLQVAVAKGWEEEYQIKPLEKSPRVRVKAIAEDIVEEDAVSKPVKKKSVVKAKPKTATKKKASEPKEPKQ